jgi:hypothetical protein
MSKSGTTRYFETHGDTRNAILAMRQEIHEARQRIYKFAKKYKCTSVRVSGEGHFWLVEPEKHYKKARFINGKWQTVTITPVLSRKLWKQEKRDGQLYNAWSPRLSTKEGKAIAAAMRAISADHPGGRRLAEIIGGGDGIGGEAGGFVWYSPGFRIFGPKGKERVIVTIGDPTYKPKSKDIKRMSDLEFEQLEARRQSVGARRQTA